MYSFSVWSFYHQHHCHIHGHSCHFVRVFLLSLSLLAHFVQLFHFIFWHNMCIIMSNLKSQIPNFSPLPYKIGIWSVAKRVFVLMPTKSGEPRRVATHSSGKCFDLKAKANAPSCNRKSLLFCNIEVHLVGRLDVFVWGTYQLLNNLFDQFAEWIVGMLFVQVIDQFRNHFGIGFRFKTMPFRFEETFDIFVVGDDAIVDDNKRMLAVRSLWMRIRFARATVSRPTCVRNANVCL